MMSRKLRALGKNTPIGSVLAWLENTKASICTKAEHPFRFIKMQFGFVKV